MVAEEIARGGVVVYPTDTAFALGCHLGDKTALERIVRIRQLHKNHQFTVACRDLSELGTYARVDTSGFRLLKRLTANFLSSLTPPAAEVPVVFQQLERTLARNASRWVYSSAELLVGMEHVGVLVVLTRR